MACNCLSQGHPKTQYGNKETEGIYIGLALQLLQLFNAAQPGIAELLLIIRRKDGTISIGAVLDEADAQFKENITQASDWLKANPKP